MHIYQMVRTTGGVRRTTAMEKALQINVLKFIATFSALIASQILVECHAQNSFEIKTLNCTFSANYFNQSTGECLLKSVDGRNKFVSGHAELTKAIDELVVNVNVYLKSTLGEGRFHLLFNITENVCSLADEMGTSRVASIVHPIWQQYTNIPMKCPIKPGEYYVKEIDYNDLAGHRLPVTIPSGHYKINVTARNKNEFVMSGSALLSVKMRKKST